MSAPAAPAIASDHPALHVVIGAATAAATIAVAWGHRDHVAIAVLLGVTVACYGLLAAIDAAEQRLPNRITLPLAAASFAAVIVGGIIAGDPLAALGAIGTGLAFAAVFIVLRFGMGDVKLALTVGTIAGWLGREAIVATIVFGSISGALVALGLIIVHRRTRLSFAFGPFLAIGSVAGMLAAGS